MKILIILVSFIATINPSKQVSDLYGEWELEKIIIKGDTLTPYRVDYFLTIKSDLILYNLDVNTYQAEKFTITDKRIEIETTGATMVCCDGRDTITNYIDYNCEYQIVENQLVFSKENTKIYLNKLEADIDSDEEWHNKRLF